MALRARQLDIGRKLAVIRDIDELDKVGEGGVSRSVTHGHHALDAENEEALTVKDAKTAEAYIPTPPVLEVPSYRTDYRPIFKQPAAYLRSGTTGATLPVACNANLPSTSIPLAVPAANTAQAAGETVSLPAACVDLRDAYMVEYDMDEEDEAWLKDFNGNQERLTADKLEYCLWKLECAWSEAQEAVLGRDAAADGAGGGGGGQGGHTAGIGIKNAAMLLNPDYLDRETGCNESLKNSCVRVATRYAVYNYWLAKRKKFGRPILRRLVPPPSISDNNPYNVFHPREKAHRPQTRRRHFNDESALDKAKDLKRNLETGRALLDHVYRRERKKLEIALCTADYRRALIATRHDGKAAVDALAEQLAAKGADGGGGGGAKRASAAGVAAAIAAVQHGSTGNFASLASAAPDGASDEGVAWNALPPAALAFGGDYKRRAEAILEAARPTSVFRRPLFSIKKRKKDSRMNTAAAANAAEVATRTAAIAAEHLANGPPAPPEAFPLPLDGKPVMPPEHPGDAPLPELLCMRTPDWGMVDALMGDAAIPEAERGMWRPRFGRGGRIVLDRVEVVEDDGAAGMETGDQPEGGGAVDTNQAGGG